MNKAILILCAVFLSALIFSTHCSAGLIDYERLRKYRQKQQAAEKEAAEKASPRRRSSKKDEEPDYPKWLITEPRVKTRAERRYDVNRDGKLQTAETKVYLRGVLEVIDEKGGFTINSNVLKEYDKNKDGVISRREAKQIEKYVR